MSEKDLSRPLQTGSETEIAARRTDRQSADSEASGTAGGSRYREFVDVGRTPTQERKEVRQCETRQATTK